MAGAMMIHDHGCNIRIFKLSYLHSGNLTPRTKSLHELFYKWFRKLSRGRGGCEEMGE